MNVDIVMRARMKPITEAVPSCMPEGSNGQQEPAVGFSAWHKAFRRQCKSNDPKERAACEELLQLIPDPGDRAMVDELYLRCRHAEKVADDHGYSQSGLYKRVNMAMKKIYKKLKE